MGHISSYLLDIVHPHKDSLAPLIEDGQFLRKLMLVYRRQSHLPGKQLVPEEVILCTASKVVCHTRQQDLLHSFRVTACSLGPSLPTPWEVVNAASLLRLGLPVTRLLDKCKSSILKQNSAHIMWALVGWSKIFFYPITSAFSPDRLLYLVRAAQKFHI